MNPIHRLNSIRLPPTHRVKSTRSACPGSFVVVSEQTQDDPDFCVDANDLLSGWPQADSSKAANAIDIKGIVLNGMPES
jgi:hypothetical protein